MPAVSVVMSVYNGQEFLAEAVESVAGQTFSDFEFVIVDDGSTDATADILAEYAKRDRRVRVLRHENRGRPESLNRGIEAATAPLIARMDADDVSLRQRFEQQVEFMRARPDVVLLGGAAELITPERRTLRVYQPPTEDTELRATLLRHNPFRHPALMLRREAVLGVGGYRKALLDADD